MPVRTTFDAVSLIAEVDTAISPDLAPYIETANFLVNNLCATETKTVDDVEVPFYDATGLELIERWLSAHFYHIRDPRAHWEAAGSVSERLESQVDLNLAQTKYGQTAMILDIAGGLARWNRTIVKGGLKSKATMTWLGTDTVEDEDEL